MCSRSTWSEGARRCAHRHLGSDDPARLGKNAAIELRNLNNQLLLGAGTLWELSIKVGIGKLSLSLPYRQWMNKAIADLGLAILPVTVEYADLQAGLPRHHADPFDRLLVAQAIAENAHIISADAQLDAYAIRRIW
jgi:PIN domain nuclease of toxin-antitoxin system